MKKSDKQWEFLLDVALLIQFAHRKGWKLTGGELWRTNEQQAWYVERGLSQTRQGQHQKRLAIDLNLFIKDEFRTDTESHQPLGEFWESIRPENRWGGRFNDGNHYERI